jgi:DNA-binding CsgD family transcriptional regulator
MAARPGDSTAPPRRPQRQHGDRPRTGPGGGARAHHRQLVRADTRERHVTELLLRGLPIDEIGSALWISRHTVRDHTKAIFAKGAVGSRPELMAKLFNDHFLQAMNYEQ